jgi:hypothetical protein
VTRPPPRSFKRAMIRAAQSGAQDYAPEPLRSPFDRADDAPMFPTVTLIQVCTSPLHPLRQVAVVTVCNDKSWRVTPDDAWREAERGDIRCKWSGSKDGRGFRCERHWPWSESTMREQIDLVLTDGEGLAGPDGSVVVLFESLPEGRRLTPTRRR